MALGKLYLNKRIIKRISEHEERKAQVLLQEMPFMTSVSPATLPVPLKGASSSAKMHAKNGIENSLKLLISTLNHLGLELHWMCSQKCIHSSVISPKKSCWNDGWTFI